MDDRSKPVRNGDKYCSPRCGRGCTYAEYEAAVKLADSIVSDLGALLCLPHVHGTDGAFAVRLERTEDYVEPS